MHQAIDDWFEKYGPSQGTSAPANNADTEAWFEKYGPSQGAASAAEPAAAAPAAGNDAIWAQIPGHQTPAQQARDRASASPDSLDSNAGAIGKDMLSEFGQAPARAKQYLGEATDTLKQGIGEIGQGMPASGIGHVAQGLIGEPGALFQAGVSIPTGNILNKTTGTPDFGERAWAVTPTSAGRALMRSAPMARTALAAPQVQAIQRVIDKLAPGDAQAALDRMESNPNLALMDVSEPARTMAGGLAADATSPAAQSKMSTAYKQRVADRTDVVKQAADAVLGPAPDVKTTLEGMKQAARDTGKTKIQPAIEATPPVDVMPIIRALDEQIGPNAMASLRKNNAPAEGFTEVQKAAAQLRKQLLDTMQVQNANEATRLPKGATAPTQTVTPTTVDPSVLHELQSKLRLQAESAFSGTDGMQRFVAGEVTAPVRRMLVDSIDKASGGTAQAPGRYRQALRDYADDKAVDDAFHKGFDETFKTGGGLETFPEYWHSWAQDASDREIEAVKLGQLSKVRQQIEGFANGARRGENIIAPPFVRERFESVWGPEKTRQLEKLLEDSRDMATTNARLFQNSHTAVKQSALSDLEPPPVRAPGAGSTIGPVVGALGSGAAYLAGAEPYGIAGAAISGLLAAERVGSHVSRVYRNASVQRRNSALADLLAANSGPARDKVLDILRSAAAKESGTGKKIPNLLRAAVPYLGAGALPP